MPNNRLPMKEQRRRAARERHLWALFNVALGFTVSGALLALILGTTP
jgi:hypothetical protein